VAPPGNEQPIGAFTADAAHPPLGDRVRSRRPHGSRDNVDAHRGEDRIERSGELGVPVADHKPQLVDTPAEVHKQVARLLRHPQSDRVRGDAGQMDPPAAVLDEEQDIQPSQEHCLNME
jgi:hypothetical protein